MHNVASGAALVGAKIAICGLTLAFYWLALTRPKFFAPQMPAVIRKTTRRDIVLSVGAMLGTGVCVYSGALYALNWMPRWLTLLDGDWAAEVLAGLVGFFAGIAFPPGVAELSSRTAGSRSWRAEYFEKKLAEAD